MHYLEISIKAPNYSKFTQVISEVIISLQPQIDYRTRIHDLKLPKEANYPRLSKGKLLIFKSRDHHMLIYRAQGKEGTPYGIVGVGSKFWQ